MMKLIAIQVCNAINFTQSFCKGVKCDFTFLTNKKIYTIIKMNKELSDRRLAPYS